MMNLTWTMISHPDKLWVRIMKAKFSCGPLIIPTFIKKSTFTSTWKAMVDPWDDVKPNCIWGINNGQDSKFWRDNWIPGVGVLADILVNSIPDAELNFPVSHYCSNGNWNWNLINRHVPADICDKIACLKPPCLGARDFPCWNLTSDGYFSLKSAYGIIHNQSIPSENPNPIFNIIWS